MEEDITYGMQTLYSCAYMLEYIYFFKHFQQYEVSFWSTQLRKRYLKYDNSNMDNYHSQNRECDFFANQI